MTVRLGDCVDEASEDGGQESPEVGEDLADVVTAAAEHSEEGAAEGAGEGRCTVRPDSRRHRASFCRLKTPHVSLLAH